MYFVRIFSLRSEINRLLTLSILFSCVLSVARIAYTGELTFASLVWNLFLAYVPFFMTHFLSTNHQLIKTKKAFSFFFLLWMICIPNSFYIITDLFHLGDSKNDYLAPQWYDLALILSFAWNGLLLGVLSVRQMEKIAERFFPAKHELLFLCPVMIMNALGIYVGRYLRFNSWDVITNPFELARDMANIIMNPFAYKEAWGMVCCFSVLLTLMYMGIKKMSKALF